MSPQMRVTVWNCGCKIVWGLGFVAGIAIRTYFRGH